MGNLLKILYNKDEGTSKTGDIFVDFENCKPTETELKVWDEVSVSLQKAAVILVQLQQYKGASNEIRTAISNPKDDGIQEKTWETLSPLVLLLKEFYQYSLELESTVPKLLSALSSKDMTPQQHLETQQALFKQFAEILDFVLKFDDLKMTNPAIQNDFSYYRRTLNRQRLSSETEYDDEELDVNNEMANRMSLFYATATPMMKMLSDVTTKFVTENKDLPLENTTACLSAMCSICRTMIENPMYRSKFQSEETVMFCLRVMVGVITLYDHVHPVGAFAKTSPLNIKSCVKVLKDQPPEKVEGLMNALRYTTKHLNDDSTPRNIKAVLA